MAESIAAISLVSNIVSLVHFGIELVERLNAFTTDLNEVPTCFRTLKTQLPLLTDNLQRTKTHIETGATSRETTLALAPVVDNCLQELGAIKAIIDRTIPPLTARRSEKWIKAIRSFSGEKDVERHAQSLEKNILSLLHYHAISATDINTQLLALALEQRSKSDAVNTLNTFTNPDLTRSLLPDGAERDSKESEVHQNMTQEALDNELSQIIDWIAGVDTVENFQDALIARASNTCNWILQNPTFIAWNNPDVSSCTGKALWIHGPPGFGKTVLCASIIYELCQRATASVGYFFCAAEDESKRQAYGILRSWIHQLMQRETKSVETVREAYRFRTASKATEPELWNIFESMGTKCGTCIFVVDGFDECDTRKSNSKLHAPDHKISFLRRLLQCSPKFKFQLLLVSRYDSSIKSLWNAGLAVNSTLFYEYEISNKDTFNDVNTFSALVVDQQLSNKKENDRIKITNDIVQRCDGMFLWVRLLQQRLSPGKNLKQLRTIVSETPSDIRRLYAREIERIMKLDADDRNRAIAILRWTLFATRPLTVKEITEALLVDIEPVSPPEGDYPWDALPDEYDAYYLDDRIQRLCGPIICVRSGDAQNSVAARTIHFVHFSVQEYLTTVPAKILEPSPEIVFGDAAREHAILARACIRYLCYNVFQKGDISHDEVDTLLQQFDFLDYAAKSWSIHATQGPISDQKLHSLLRLFFKSSHYPVNSESSRWEAPPALAVWNLWPKIFEEGSFRTPNRLYYASLFGFEQIAEHLLLEGVDLNKSGGRYYSPLNAAVMNGREQVVRLLLEHGTRTDTNCFEFGSALIGAVVHGTDKDSENMVRLLLENGADVTATDQFGSTALHHAAREDKTNVIEVLLKHGVSTDSTDYKGAIALHWVALLGSPRAAFLLLNKDSTLDKRQKDGFTPLHNAAICGNRLVAEMLLENGADISCVTSSRRTALHNAASYGNIEVLEVLLKYGADVAAADYRGETALHGAAWNGMVKAVQLLLKYDADVAANNAYGQTALHKAACNGNVEVVKILLKHGADLAIVSRIGATALHTAAHMGHVKVVELLLQNGANPDLQTQRGRTALHEAVYCGHVPVLRAILTVGPNVLLPDEYGRTCLDWLSNSPMHSQLLGRNVEPCSADEAAKARILEINLRNRLRQVGDDESRFYRLGHCLILLGELQEACTAFEREVKTTLEAKVITHFGVTCNRCPDDSYISGKRYVCVTCPAFDLCRKCKEQYIVYTSHKKRVCNEEESFEDLCHEHEFLEVPGKDWSQLAPGQVNSRGESRQEWLARLEALVR